VPCSSLASALPPRSGYFHQKKGRAISGICLSNPLLDNNPVLLMLLIALLSDYRCLLPYSEMRII